jgi:hypothetical protein
LVESPISWPVVEHLAGKLLDRRTMTGDEVESAILEGYAKDFAERKARRLRK